MLMRVIMIAVLACGVSGCADLSKKPVRSSRSTTAQPVYTVKNAEAEYNACIKKQMEKMADTKSAVEPVADRIIASCSTELAKISTTFGQDLTTKVKHADPAATGKFYASAYESKTRKQLIKDLTERR